MRLLAPSLAAAVVAIPLAAAALTPLTGGALGAGSATLGRCDADGFHATYVTSGLNVTDVVVSGIADTCEGGTLKLRITNSSGASIAAGGPRALAVDVDTLDSTETVPVVPQPTAASAMRITMVVEGA